MKKNLLLKVVAVALIAIAFISCKKEIQPTGIKLNQTTLALETGGTANLIATVEPAGAVGSVSWSSSNDGVASIADGVVTAKSAGSATITAKISTFSATCTVTVTDPYVKVTSVTIDKTSLDMVEGDAVQLTATVAPDNATDKAVTWKSSDTKVATVSASGEVVAVAEGKATITATAGDASASCEVAVAKKVIAVESVTLNNTALELTEGETATLTATVLPDNATDKTVTWTSDNTAVATVADGVVTAKAEGTAKITAKAGDASAVCTVTVKKKVIAVESITLDKTTLELTVGGTATLTATVKPDNATDKTVTWSCDNTGVATVADGVVTAVAEGTAKVTAKAGDATAVCTVTVKADVVKVTEITINEVDFSLGIGDTKALTVTVKPDNATDKSVTWSSDQPGVATVSSTGVVTAVAAGNAKITAKANGGDVSDFVNVTVTAAEPEGTSFEDWIGTWNAKSGVKKNTLEITAISDGEGNILENMYYVYGWQKFENVPFFGSFMDGDLAFVGGDGMPIIEDAVLFDDDPEEYDLIVVGWFKYQGSEYFLTGEDPYITATGSLDGNKCTMEAASFELEGETFTFTKTEFLVKQKTGDDAGEYYKITNENPLPYPVKLTKSSSGAPAKAKSAVKASGVKFEKVPVSEFAFRR
ncbi:MAG: Ig-like domain-containing protein [Bacteroidales bacterium]|nr:Ig-like domain-containing protein [Bacteroidales bacterium]